MANRNFASGGKMYSGHVMPVLLDCNFVVDRSNGNGLGIRSLKGPYVQAVYMNTSATPAASNPNPAQGTIIVQLQDNYNRIYTGGHTIVSPIGTPLKVDASDAALTPGVAYIITILGDATAADWLALGVPAGVAPAVGVAFIALVSGSGTASVTRVAPTAAAGSNVASIETVGDSNLSLAPNPTANQGFGGQIILQCRDYAGALVQPAAGSVISLSFLLSNSSVLIQGE